MDEAALIEEVARALAVADRIEICSDAQYRHSSYGIKAAAILPIIRRIHNDAVEKAARVADKRAEQRFQELGTREWDTNACYYEGARGETLEELDEEDEAIATAIRTLKEPEQ